MGGLSGLPEIPLVWSSEDRLDIAEAGQIILRLAHGLAAAVWVGGGAYYILAVRPQVRASSDDPHARELGAAVQREFGEWASVATLVMIATGVVLMFDRLTGGEGSAGYLVMMAAKVAAALVAFWMTGALGLAGRRRRRHTGRLDVAWVALGLGSFAFVVGALLSALYPVAIDW